MEHIVLVTGAGGQLGSALRAAASVSRSRFIFTSRHDDGSGDPVLDITDPDAVSGALQNSGADIVVNCAAYTDIDRAEGNPEEADLLNHIAVGDLAEAARECSAVLIHISCSDVFSGESPVPYREYDETAPSGVYGITKLAGERAVMDSGCSYIILRTCCLLSRKKNGFLESLLSEMFGKNSVKACIDRTFSPTSADDLAEAIVRMVDSGGTELQGTYHYAGTGLCSMYDFAVAAARLSGSGCEVMPCRHDEMPSYSARPAFSALDTTLFRTTFGMEIPYWRDSLEKRLKTK